MTRAAIPPRLPFWQRLFFAVPVIGWVARDVLYGDKANAWFAVVLFFSLWSISALLFGLPGVYVPAVLMVPFIFALLIWMTWA
ncbi:MAG: hypothetical protein AAGF27_11435 [Pseudomonadota bacterium]